MVRITLWNTSNSGKSCIHLGNHLNVKDPTNVCKNIAHICPLLISSSETVKYLQKVGENLIFLLSPLYFIVGFGYIVMLRARMCRSLIPVLMIKERNIRARNITI